MAIERCEGCDRTIDLDWVDMAYAKMNGEDVPLCEACMDRIRRCTVCGVAELDDPPDCPKNPAQCNIVEGPP